MSLIDFVVKKIIKRIPIINRFNEVLMYYLIISVIATVYDVALLYIFTEFLGFNYLISATISYCVGIFVGYVGQKTITFKDKDKRIAKQFGLFTFISLIGLLINLGVLKLCVDVLGIYYLIGKVIAIGVGFFWNYTANKKITFKKRK
ncbi:MAG TPA: GtrA family protein [Candidatus Diapherotrites archaeon]|nr:GtrA family protein [Candidatus Diapherotrites archaeon]